MPDSQGRFIGISVPELPWKNRDNSKIRPAWSQYLNPDGTITRTYHHTTGDESVILDPHKPLEDA